MTDYHDQCAEQLAQVLENPNDGWHMIQRPRDTDAQLHDLVQLASVVSRALQHSVPSDPTFKSRLRVRLLSVPRAH